MLPSTLLQKKTFTKWVNSKLAALDNPDYIVQDLETDLRDGHRLLALVRVLVKKTASVTHLVPEKQNQRIHHIINVGKALKCIEQCTHMPLPNIGSEDIVDGNLKLTLGLIWLLILRFQIIQIADLGPVTTKIVTGETKAKVVELKPSSSTTFEVVPAKGQPTLIKSESKKVKNASTNEKAKTSSASTTEKVDVQAQLLQWTQARLTTILPGSNLPKNFNKAWQDGQHFCFLVHGYAPTYLPLNKIKPLNDNKEDWKFNLDLAFHVAEVNLGLPKLLDSEDLVNYADEKSIMTYLSGFCELPIPEHPAIPIKVPQISQIPNLHTHLLQWVESQLDLIDPKPALPTNFHTSWQNGQSFCYLVHSIVPTHLPLSQVRFSNDNNREDWKYNLQLAFNVAETHLKVPRLLDPDTFINHIEEKWVIIYLLRLVKITLKTLIPNSPIEESTKFAVSRDVQLKLLIWIHERLFFIFPNAQVPTDFDNSWQNGLYFYLLVYAYVPEYLSISDLRPLDENKQNWKYNLDLAFNIAEKHLGVPKLLNPDELVNDVKDERIIIYLLRFYHVILSTSRTSRFEECVNFDQAQDKKKTLLLWIHIYIYFTLSSSNIKGITLPRDFDKSWQNGQYFCYLVHYYAPQHLPLNAIRPISNNIEDWKYNLDLAFNVAEKHLGIPRLLDSENLVNHLDENYIIAYLIKFIEISIRYSSYGTLTISPKITKSITNFQVIQVQLDLLQWIRIQLQIIQPDYDLPNDLKHAWQNGQYFCCLVRGYAPNQLPLNAIRPANNNKDDWKHNLNLAFNVAFNHLGIPKILDSDTLIYHADEQKIIEYLSKFLKVSCVPSFPTSNEVKTVIYSNEIKIKILLWIHTCFSIFQYKVPLPTNFHSAWQNGQYFAFLVHCYAPNQLALDEIKPLNDNKQNWKFNLDLAFEIAEKYLGISRLLDSDQLLNDVNESKIIEYLLQFGSLPNLLEPHSSSQGLQQNYSLEEKKRLLEITRTYLSSCIPQSNLPNDFRNSWQDGQLFCYLVHLTVPNCLPLTQIRPKNNNKNDWKYNLDLAFETAEKHLGISKRLKSDEVLKSVDENEAISYISQFFDGKVLMTANPTISSNSQLSVDTKRVAYSSSDALKPASPPLDSGTQITPSPRTPQVANPSNSPKTLASGNAPSNSPPSPSASPSKRLSLLPLNIANALGASSPLSALTAYAASFVLPKSPSSSDISSSLPRNNSSWNSLDQSSSDTTSNTMKREATQTSISVDSIGFNGPTNVPPAPVQQASIQKKPSLTESLASYVSSFVPSRQSSILEEPEEGSPSNDPDKNSKETDIERSSSSTFSSFSGYFSSLLMPSNMSNTSNEKAKAQKENKNYDTAYSSSQPDTLNEKEEKQRLNVNIGAHLTNDASRSEALGDSASLQGIEKEEKTRLIPETILGTSIEKDIETKTLDETVVFGKMPNQVFTPSDSNKDFTGSKDLDRNDSNASNANLGFEISKNLLLAKQFDTDSQPSESLLRSEYQKNSENIKNLGLVDKEPVEGFSTELVFIEERKKAENILDTYGLESEMVNVLAGFKEVKKTESTTQPLLPIPYNNTLSSFNPIQTGKSETSTHSYTGLEEKSTLMSPLIAAQVEYTRQEMNGSEKIHSMRTNFIHTSSNHILEKELPLNEKNANVLSESHSVVLSDPEQSQPNANIKNHQNEIQVVNDTENQTRHVSEGGKIDEEDLRSKIKDSDQKSSLRNDLNTAHVNKDFKELQNTISSQALHNSKYSSDDNKQNEVIDKENEWKNDQSQSRFIQSQVQENKRNESLQTETNNRLAMKRSSLPYTKAYSEMDSSKKIPENGQSSTVVDSDPAESKIYGENLMKTLDSTEMKTKAFNAVKESETPATENTNLDAQINVLSSKVQIQKVSVETQEEIQLESIEGLSKFTIMDKKQTQPDSIIQVKEVAVFGTRSESFQTKIPINNTLSSEPGAPDRKGNKNLPDFSVRDKEIDSFDSQNKNYPKTKLAHKDIANNEVTSEQEKSVLEKEIRKESPSIDIRPKVSSDIESTGLSRPKDEIPVQISNETFTDSSTKKRKEKSDYGKSFNDQSYQHERGNSGIEKAKNPEDKNLDIRSLKKNRTKRDSIAEALYERNLKQTETEVQEVNNTSGTNQQSLEANQKPQNHSSREETLPLRCEAQKTSKISNDELEIEFYEIQSEFKSEVQLDLRVPDVSEKQKNDLKEIHSLDILQRKGSFALKQDENHDSRNQNSQLKEKVTLETNADMQRSCLPDGLEPHSEVSVGKQDSDILINVKTEEQKKELLISNVQPDTNRIKQQLKSSNEPQKVIEDVKSESRFEAMHEPKESASHDVAENNLLQQSRIQILSQPSQTSSPSEAVQRQPEVKEPNIKENVLVERKEVDVFRISILEQGRNENEIVEHWDTLSKEDTSQHKVIDTTTLLLVENVTQIPENHAPNFSGEAETLDKVVERESPISKEKVNGKSISQKPSAASQQSSKAGFKKDRKASLDSALVQRKPGKGPIKKSVHSVGNKVQQNDKKEEASPSRRKSSALEMTSAVSTKDGPSPRNKAEKQQMNFDAQHSDETKKAQHKNLAPENFQQEKVIKTQTILAFEEKSGTVQTGVEKVESVELGAQVNNDISPMHQLQENMRLVNQNQIESQGVFTKDSDTERERSAVVKDIFQIEPIAEQIQDVDQNNQDTPQSLESENKDSPNDLNSNDSQLKKYVAETESKTKGSDSLESGFMKQNEDMMERGLLATGINTQVTEMKTAPQSSETQSNDPGTQDASLSKHLQNSGDPMLNEFKDTPLNLIEQTNYKQSGTDKEKSTSALKIDSDSKAILNQNLPQINNASESTVLQEQNHPLSDAFSGPSLSSTSSETKYNKEKESANRSLNEKKVKEEDPSHSQPPALNNIDQKARQQTTLVDTEKHVDLVVRSLPAEICYPEERKLASGDTFKENNVSQTSILSSSTEEVQSKNSKVTNQNNDGVQNALYVQSIMTQEILQDTTAKEVDPKINNLNSSSNTHPLPMRFDDGPVNDKQKKERKVINSQENDGLSGLVIAQDDKTQTQSQSQDHMMTDLEVNPLPQNVNQNEPSTVSSMRVVESYAQQAVVLYKSPSFGASNKQTEISPLVLGSTNSAIRSEHVELQGHTIEKATADKKHQVQEVLSSQPEEEQTVKSVDSVQKKQKETSYQTVSPSLPASFALLETDKVALSQENVNPTTKDVKIPVKMEASKTPQKQANVFKSSKRAASIDSSQTTSTRSASSSLKSLASSNVPLSSTFPSSSTTSTSRAIKEAATASSSPSLASSATSLPRTSSKKRAKKTRSANTNSQFLSFEDMQFQEYTSSSSSTTSNLIQVSSQEFTTDQIMILALRHLSNQVQLLSSNPASLQVRMELYLHYDHQFLCLLYRAKEIGFVSPMLLDFNQEWPHAPRGALENLFYQTFKELQHQSRVLMYEQNIHRVIGVVLVIFMAWAFFYLPFLDVDNPCLYRR